MPIPLAAVGIASILSNVFGNLWGAHSQAKSQDKAINAQTAAQNRAAELEYQAVTDALNYQKSIDARDYSDWLNREARDRADWEAHEQRRAPFRALADSAVRTLADYIRVPGMQAPQEIPVQHWTAPQAPQAAPVNTTMPVGGTLYNLTQAAPQRMPPSAGLVPVNEQTLLARYSRPPQTLRDLTYV